MSKNDLLKYIATITKTNHFICISWVLFLLNTAIFCLMMTSAHIREAHKVDAAFFSELIQPLTALVIVISFWRKIKTRSFYNIALLISFIFLLGEEEGWGTSRFNYHHPDWILPYTTSNTLELHTITFYGIEVEFLILAILFFLWAPFFFLRPFGFCKNFVHVVLSKKTSILLFLPPILYLVDVLFLHLPDKGYLDLGDFWGIELELIFYQILLVGILKAEVVGLENKIGH